jgi:hypothetical protein
MAGILILDQLINRRLIKRLHITEAELEKKYVNNPHKYGEKLLYSISFIVMFFAIYEFHQLRIFIFIGMAALFAFRTLMKWKHAEGNRSYILSSVTCGLFVVGAVVYAVSHVLIT